MTTRTEQHPLDDHVTYCPTRHPEDRHGTPVWCLTCTQHIRAALTRLPDLAAHAGERRDGRLTPGSDGSDRTRHSTRTGSPSGSPAWDEVDDVISWAAAWADALARHLDHAGPTRYRPDGIPARDLTGSVRYLTAHLSAALSPTFAAEDFGREVRALARRLERVTGRDAYVQRLPGVACPACDARALVREDGADQVDCRVCHRSWPEEDYRRLALVVADEQRRAG